MSPLHVGDIVFGLSRDDEPYPILVTDIETGPLSSIVLGRGRSMLLNGAAMHGHMIYSADRLIACGRDEDCRASLDLAMACAEQRRSSPLAIDVASGHIES